MDFFYSFLASKVKLKNKKLNITPYEYRNDVDIEEFINTNDFLSCDKSSKNRFYNVSGSGNKIIITEYNKMEQNLFKFNY